MSVFYIFPLCFFTLLSSIFLVSSVKVAILPYGSAQLRAVGDTLSLTCSVRGQLHGSTVDIRWLDTAGQPIPVEDHLTTSTRRVYSQKTHPGDMRLFFSRLQEEDFGIYSCLVIQGGRYYRRSVTVQVYKPINYVDCPENQTLYRGRPGLIRCKVTASPKPIVSWTSKGRIITTDQRYEVTSNGLKIYDVKDEDTGNYYCMATLTSQGVFKTRTINVRVVDPPVDEGRAPHIARVQLSAPGPQDDMALTCLVAGNPAPDIEWFMLGDAGYQLVEGEGLSSVEQTKQEGLTVGVLRVTPGRVQGVESYMCSTLNKHGHDRQIFNLTSYNVTDESVSAPNIDRIHMNRTQGSFHDVMVTCVASGFPTPFMAWVRRGTATDNQPIQSEGRVFVAEDRRDGEAVLTLIIRQATPDDQGVYICSATNAKASVRQQFEFDVLGRDTPDEAPEAPHISRVHVNRTGAGQEDTTVTCVAEGIPSPHISFTRETQAGLDQQLEPDDRMEVNHEDKPGQTTVSVTWKKSVPEDAGAYKCVASNIAGTVNQKFDIYHKDWRPRNMWPPQVLKLHISRTGVEDRNITVRCEAIATPAPHMNWLRDGEIVFPDDRRSVSQAFDGDIGVLVLGIQHARPQDDDGIYTCSAVNIAGKSEQNFTLETEGYGTQQIHFHNEGYFHEGEEDWSQFGHASQLRGRQWYYQTQSQPDIPGPPSLVQIASFTDRKVVLRIARPHNTKDLSQYHIKYSFGGYEPTDKYVDYQEDYTDVELENLSPSTTYQVQISSVSKSGESRPTVLSFTTPALRLSSQSQVGQSEDLEWLRKKKKVPQSAPSRLEVEGVENNVRAAWLSWDWVPYVKPADYVQGFQVLYTTDPGLPYESWRSSEVAGDTSRSYIVQGLEAGQQYTFIVRGRNRYGLGPMSERIVYRVRQAPEIPPRNFLVESVRGKPTDVRFTWTPLDRESAGAEVTEYRIYYSTSLNQPVSTWQHQSVRGSERSTSLTGLRPATTYYFRIQSRNADGGSPVSSYIVYRTPTVRVSDPPSYVDVTSTSPTQIKLRVNRPVNSGGYPIDGYVVEYEPAQRRRASNRQVLDTDDAYFVDFVIRNLNPSTEYIFRVSARTRMGYSRPMELRISTPTTNLLKPRDLTTDYDPATAKLTLRWKRPLLPTIRVKGYTVLWSPSVPGAEALVLDVPGRQTSAEITNLLPNTVYSFQVRTESTSGSKSPYTSAVSFKTPAVPDPPSDLSIEHGEGDSVAIRIARPRDLMGNPLVGYRLRYFAADEEGSFEEIFTEASVGSVYTPINVKGLAPGIKYKFEVVSQTSAGFSSPRTIEFITPQRYQHQGQVAVEQESLGSQQSQDENLDREWLKELERQQTQEQATSRPGLTARPPGREPTTSYTVSWDVFQGSLAGLVKYIVSYREVDVDPITEEVLSVTSDYQHQDVAPTTHSLQLDNLVRNRHYEIEVTAISRVGPSILKYTIKKFIYWVPPEIIIAPHIANIYQNKTGPEGKDVQITCEATGSPGPRLSWMKKTDDGYRKVQTADRFDIHERISKKKAVTTLVIRDVASEDYGTYACSAVSPAGNSSHDFNFVADEPVVDPQPPHVYRIHVNRTGPTGEDIMVTCKASGRPSPKMKWMRNAETLFPSKEGRVTTSSSKEEDETILTLLIRYPVSGDAGTYHCVAKNSVGSTKQKFTIETDYSPENLVAPHISRIHVNHTGEEDKDVLVVCQASGSPAPELRWSRLNNKGTYDIVWPGDRHEISQTEDIDFTDIRMVIREATESDYGTYRCTAANFADTVHQNFYISFVRPENVVTPQLTRVSVSQLVDDDNDISIICTATGIPAPEMSLMRKNAEGIYEFVFPDDRMTIEQDKGVKVTTFSLTIDDPAPYDTGDYACSAANLGGRVQQQFLLDTEALPVTNLEGPAIIRINAQAPESKGGDVSLSCVASGTPAPDVTWQAFGQEISANDKYAVKQTKGIRETLTKLTIRKGSVDDAHPYTCSAQNVVGKDSKVYALTIQDVLSAENIHAPHIEHVHLNSTGPEGADATLTCLADGYPVPEMTLLRQGPAGTFERLKSLASRRVRKFEEGDKSYVQLVISPATKEHAGLYRCSAENVAGAVTQDIQADLPVKVLENAELPHISRIHINRTGHDRADVTVTCIARGYPAPLMKWLRFDELVLPRGRFSIQENRGVNQTVISLTILQAVPEDEGSYRCSAVNVAGSVAQLFDIELQDAVAKYRPHISRVHINWTGIEYDDLKVTCVANGPAEMSFWKKTDKDYEIVLPLDNIEIEDDKNEDRTIITMVLRRPTPEQAGEYQCLARNPAGEATQPFSLDTEVLPVPEDSVPPHVSRIHVNRTGEGDRDVAVTCRVDGIPAPATNWLRRDKSGQFEFVWSDERYAIYEYRDSKGTILTLTISQATSADDGIFLCSASNIAGNAHHPFTLNVFEKPPQNPVPPTVRWIHVSRQGPSDEDVVVTCVGAGSPAPEVGLWRRDKEQGDDYLIQVGGRVSVNYTKGADETTLNVSFLKAQVSDEGTYVCSATNRMGAVKQDFDLHVENTLPTRRELPHISRIHINKTQDGDVMVVCLASGLPRPLMDWLRPNEEGVPKSMEIKNYHVVEVDQVNNTKTFTLIIQQPTALDRGDYYCSARNLAGRVIQKFTVGSEDIPKESLRQPQIAHVHMNMTGEESADMMLTCVVTGTPPPLLSWWRSYGPGDFNRIWPGPRHQMDGSDTADGSVLTLVIPKATPEDDGLYRCSAVSIAGSAGQVTMVQLPGGPPENLRPPHIEQVHINRTSGPEQHLMVTCVAKGSPGPEMRWMREEEDGGFRNVGAHAEDVTIQDYKGENKSVLTLVVENATPEDWDGKYRCHATNYAGKTHQDFKLQVQVSLPDDVIAPFIDRVHVNSSGLNEEDLMITCRALGFPPPLINLLRKDDQGEYQFMKPASEEGAIVQEQKDASVLALILTNPRNAGRGHYRCQAANIAGVVREDFDYNIPVLGGKEEQHPHISRIHVDRAGDFNEDVTMMCKATGNPAPHMNWWKYSDGQFQLVWPREDLIIAEQDIPDGSQLTMRIRQATPEADGDYLCSAANYVGTAKQRFDFKVFESPPEDLVPATISWLHFNRTGPYKKGLLITCLANGNPAPEMRWYKRSDTGRDRLVLPTNDVVIEQVTEGRNTQLTLAIDNPSESDAGLYTCETANVGGTASYNVKAVLSEEPVKDKLPPHITRIHVDREGDNREHISMYCQATGFPPPDIKWMKDMAPQGRQIDYRYIWPVGRVDAREEKTYNSTTVHLLIRFAEPEDAGNYLCLAANIAGEVQQAFDVETSDELPEHTETPHVEWIHMNRTGLNNNDMSVTCVARGVPPPTVWFYRGDPRQGTELITPSERNSFYQIQGSTKTTLKLTLRNIREEDAGPYLCKATNLAGYRSHPFDLVVTEPEIPNQRLPHVSHIRVSRTGIQNQHVLMACEAEGNPAPELNWWRNEGTADTPQFRLLWPGDKYDIHQEQEAEKTTLSLTIKDVNEESLDTYLCSAANIGGQTRQRFELTALPSATEDEDEPHVERLLVTRTEDSELQLICSADGLPPPELQMYKLDETGAYQLLKPMDRVRFFETNGVDSTNLQVTIQQATEKDAGSYLCSAANRLGAARKAMDYTVQDAPYDDEIPPHISHIHMNRTTADGADVMVTCLVQGSPAPTVMWLKDYSERGGQDFRLLPPVGAHRIRQEKFSDHTVATLVIPEATERDDGWYRCEASNPWGETNQDFEVIVHADLPRTNPPHVSRINVNKTGVNKQDLTLTCVASGEPAPGMNFYKQSDDGNFYLVLPASAEDISEMRGAGETTLRLVIKDFALEDFGLYRCAAANLGGRVSQTFNVEIDDTPREDQEKPYITRIFVDRSVEDPRDVTLTCVANGVPAPEMRWRQRDLTGSDVTMPSSRFDIEQIKFEDYSVIVLTVRRATFADDGTFICEAANVVDRVTQPFSLRVFATPPDDLLAPKVSSFYVNQSRADVNMYCVARGQPPPDLYLSKLDATGNYVAVKPRTGLDFTQKKEDQRTTLRLHIKDASEANAGSYICTASSLIGTSRRKFEFTAKEILPVEVQGRPYIRRILVEEPKADDKVLTVKCFGEGDPAPNMMFFRRNAQSGLDERIKSGGRYRVRKLGAPDGVLLEVKVKNAGPSDTGVYICRAVNKKGTHRTKFNLTVEEYSTVRKGAPEFIQPRVERTGLNGEDVQVTCRARGDPAPDMLFLRQEQDGPETKYKAITTDGRYIVEENKGEVETVLKIIIRQATSSDAGTYVCSARNSKGSPRQQFTLTIQDTHELPEKPQALGTLSSEHSILVLWSPPEDPSRTPRGYFVGYGLGFPDLFKVKLPADQLSYVIKKLNPGTEYIISVGAYNDQGESLPAYITEHTKPKREQSSLVLLLPVVGVEAEALSPTSIRLRWQDISPQDTGATYSVRFASRTANNKRYQYLNTSFSSADVSNLQPGQLYEFSVRTERRGDRSPWSMTVLASTPVIISERLSPIDQQQTVNQGQDQQTTGRPRFGGVQVLRSGVNDADITITCQSQGSPVPLMEFFRQVDGQFTRIKSGGRYVVYPSYVDSGSALQVVIRQATPEDAGNYMCTSSNLHGKIQQRFTLTIEEQEIQQGQQPSEEDKEWLEQQQRQYRGTTVPPVAQGRFPEFRDVLVQRSGPSGADMTVVCEVKGDPAPTLEVRKHGASAWESDTSIQTGGRYTVTRAAIPGGSRLTLVVSDASATRDRGTYVCIAQNPYATTRQQFTLNFQETDVTYRQTEQTVNNVAPRFQDVQVDRTGVNQAHVVITCRVSGSPAPDLRLWREVTTDGRTDFERIQAQGRYILDVQKHTGYSILRAEIRDATADDAGTYMCGGHNDAGSNRQQFSLTIDKPDTAEEGAPAFEDVQVDRTGSQGEDVVITCSFQGSPAPNLQLWREGTGSDVTSFQGIQTGGRYLVSQSTSGDRTVLRTVIRQATSADAGTYYCSAQNPKGSLRRQFSLTVDDQPSHPEGYPRFEDVQVDRTGVNRAHVVVTCKVHGSPAPVVNLWREVTGPDGTKYQSVQNEGRYTVEKNQYGDLSVVRAVILSASSSDAGTYLCSAQNSHGSIRQQFSLTIGGESSQQTDQDTQQNQVETIVPRRPEGYPKFQDVQVDRTGANNEDVVVTCKVSGFPAPNVQLWRQVITDGVTDYQRIRTDDRVIVDQRKYDRHTLLRGIIRTATSADAGIYLCSADNSLGSLRQQFRLTIGVESESQVGLPVIGDIGVQRTGVDQRDVEVTCSATGSPVPALTVWRRPTPSAEYELLQESDRITVQKRQEGDKGFVTVTIRRVTANDAGSYLCAAINARGTVKQEFNLTVQEGSAAKQEGLGIEGVTVDSTGEKNEDVTIKCTAKGTVAPNVRLWRYTGGNYQVLRRSRRVSLNLQRGITKSVFEVTIKKVTQADAGVYICSATNTEGTVRQQFNLTIQEHVVSGKNLPKMKDVTVVRTGPDSENALITCSVTGSPSPDVRLYRQVSSDKGKEYQLLQSGGRLILNESPEASGTVLTLFVKNVIPEDSGIYMCEASNSGGTVRQSFRWGIEAAQSDSPDLPQITSLTSDPGDPDTGHVVLKCAVSGVSTPEMKWWKRASSQLAAQYEIIFPDERLVITQTSDPSKTTLWLTIREVRPTDSGEYLCTAQNSAGSDQRTIHLQLQASESSPVISWKTEDMEVEAGSRVNLTCVASGTPVPEIKWWRYQPFKDFQLILPNDRYALTKKDMNEEVMGTLRVRKVNPADSGQYVCTAINQHGSVKGTIFLEVNSPVVQTIPNPRILVHPRDTVVERGEAARLECLTSGDPRPTISWYKDGHLVVTAVQDPAAHRLLLHDGSLFFLRVKGGSFADEGVYHCRATNEEGSVVSRNATLQVKVSHDYVSAIPRIISVKPTMSSNGSVFLYCVASGRPAPDLTWWQVEERGSATEYHQLQTGGRMAIDERKDGEQATLVLRIDHGSPQDAGNYRCIASNTFGRSKKDLVLEDSPSAPSPGSGFSPEIPVTDVTTPLSTKEDVAIADSEVPPVITPKTEDIEVEAGSRVNLTCVASGNPVPEIKWWRYEPLKDFKLILPNNRYTLTKKKTGEEITGTLSITNVSADDSGQYVCTAINQLGSVRGNILMEVTTPVTRTIPNPQILVHPRDSVVERGEPTSLECQARGEPRPTISWYKDGRLVMTAVEEPTASRLLLQDGSLFFLRVRGSPSSDEGVYQCRASNEYGIVVSRNASLRIIASHDGISAIPRIITVQPATSGNGSVFLYCVASGRPAPDLTWWQVEERAGATEYHQLQTGGRMTIDETKDGEHSTLVLRIDQASPQDAGNYRCVASNALGKSLKDLPLEDQPLTLGPEIGFTTEALVTGVTTTWSRERDVATLPGGASEITRVIRIDLDTGGIRLVCEAIGYPSPEVSWWKQDTTTGPPLYYLITSTPGREIYLQYIDGTSRLTLTLARLTTQDLGIYQCTAENYLGQSKKTLRVTGKSDDQPTDDVIQERTIVPPTPLLTTNRPTTETTTQNNFVDVLDKRCRHHDRNIQVKPSTEFEVKLEEGLLLTCDYSGHDAVFTQNLTWYTPEGQPVRDTNTSSRVSVMRESDYRQLLIIDGVRQQDAGVWTCRVVLDGQMKCGTVTLTVWKDITFSNLPRSVNGLSGQDILLTCHVDGAPLPEVSWSRNGRQLFRDERYIYTHRGLLIHDLEKGDSGKYLCEARVVSMGRYDARAVSLYVDGELTDANHGQMDKMKVTGVDNSKATGCADDGRITVPILTLMPASHLTLYSGRGLVLTCQARRTSPCDSVLLTWTDPYNQIIADTDTSRRKHVRESTESLELVIRQVLAEDGGRWTCSGATANTEVSKAVTLTVMEDVHLSPMPPLKYSVRPYQGVFLECNIDGNPAPIVGWSWAGRPITSGDQYVQERSGLRVLNVTSDRGGIYTCHAYVPETGRYRSWDIQLEVLAPPTVAIELSNQRAGSFSALICTGSGTPVPHLSWFYDHTHIVQENDRIKLERLVEAGKSSMSIIFIPLEAQDEGNYTCVAHSEGGRTQQSFLLQPLRRPGPPGNVRVVEVSPKSVTMAISPPEEDKRSPVLEYHVAYISMQNFEQTRRTVEAKNGEDVLVELVGLTPQTTYRVRIYAKNIVDFGSFKELYITTS